MENETNAQAPESGTESAEQLLMRGLRFQRIVNINMVRIFFVLWISVSLVAVVPNLRPSFSNAERRELHKFPTFSFKALFSGTYFDNISLWYSDTFPMRDNFVDLNAKTTSLLGIKSTEIHGDVINANAEAEDEENEPNKDIGQDNTTDSNSDSEVDDVVIEKIGAMAIIGNCGYEYYNFDKTAADMYIAAANRAGDMLKDKCRVFTTIAPTSIAISLNDSVAAKMNSSDQKAAIDYIQTNLSENVIFADAYTVLKEHKEEYLYFRTDHHWTADGAYYAYGELMKAAGNTTANLDAFTKFTFEGFLGSFYAASSRSPKLAETPDTVYAYEPPGLQFIHTYEKGFEKDYHIVSNADNLAESDKYLTFICGDHPLGVITNEQISDSSACLIVKESFGNAMAAYFTQNYHTVYVVDYRTIKAVYGGNLQSFTDENGVSDVFFVNNISATRNRQLMELISDFVG